MNILYYSVHQILEDDEVRLFQRLGHNVICLGSNSPSGTVHDYRPAVHFSEAEIDLYNRFNLMGGKYSYGLEAQYINIPPSFMDLIDVTIVMHDPAFIIHFWEIIRVKAVVWRTIGQGVDRIDDVLSSYRSAGLVIVRYSPIELSYKRNIGCDAIIRFGKSEETYSGWKGNVRRVLTFANLFGQRYPEDFNDYKEIVDGLPVALGGSGNDGFDNALGAVSWDEQLNLLRSSMVYLYASGSIIPYTLNFVEAWICGIPIVVYSPLNRQGEFFEVDRLVEDGENGFICRSIAAARDRITMILDDRELRIRISQNGQIAARKIFGEPKIENEWSQFLARIQSFAAATAVSSQKGKKAVNSGSRRVFEALSLLTPFDIDVGKIHIGNERDGGYVFADNFSSLNDVISFGVGPDVTFEVEMARRGHHVYLHDHTVDGPGQTHERFTFNKVGVGGAKTTSAELKTLDDCLEMAGQLSERLLLKMDVEGCEWDVFSTLSDKTLERFDQIVMEVHWLENLASDEFEAKVSESLRRINLQFTLFHVHANNCAGITIVQGFTVASVLELSFVRTSLVKRQASRTIYPTSLNKPNHPDFPDHPLLFFPFMPTNVGADRLKEVVTRIDLEA